MELLEGPTNDPLADVTVTAVSQDGTVTLPSNVQTGNATEMLMLGTWSLYRTKRSAQRLGSWTPAGPFNTDDAVDNVLALDSVYADLEVEIGGKVYWDLDNDSSLVNSRVGKHDCHRARANNSCTTVRPMKTAFGVCLSRL